jgi:hypothetical protein
MSWESREAPERYLIFWAAMPAFGATAWKLCSAESLTSSDCLTVSVAFEGKN